VVCALIPPEDSWTLGASVIDTNWILVLDLRSLVSLSTFLFQTPLKIVQFADLHFGEAPNLDWGPLQDINSTRVMNYILNSEYIEKKRKIEVNKYIS
jgi:predicted MPP superfamily phosphohydrolase